MKYTLDTDFSALNRPKAANWLRNFVDLTESAFADCDSCSRLLGNLLVMELCACTLRQGLDAQGNPFPPVIQRGLDMLWNCLKEQMVSTDMQDFANDLYACSLEHNAGEDLTDTQEVFFKKHFGGSKKSTYEWSVTDDIAVLLMKCTAIYGGRLDFEEFEACEQIDFREISYSLDFFQDVCIGFTNTPCPTARAKDVEKALELVYQTPLFRQLVGLIQGALKTALTATPEQYSALMTSGICPAPLGKRAPPRVNADRRTKQSPS